MYAKPLEQTAGFLNIGFLRLRSEIVVDLQNDALGDEENDLLQFAAFASVLGPSAVDTLPQDNRPALWLYAPLTDFGPDNEAVFETSWSGETDGKKR